VCELQVTMLVQKQYVRDFEAALAALKGCLGQGVLDHGTGTSDGDGS
jgi:hypothetical protein